MPYIKRLKTTNRSEQRKRRNKEYCSTEWRKLRDAYLMNHPLCELHLNGNEALGLEGNLIVSAEDVHHIISPFDKGMEYMLDPYNLLALCKQCHGTIHSHHLESTLYPIYDKRRND